MARGKHAVALPGDAGNLFLPELQHSVGLRLCQSQVGGPVTSRPQDNGGGGYLCPRRGEDHLLGVYPPPLTWSRDRLNKTVVVLWYS